MKLAGRLKALRQSKQLTQQQLADQLHINRATYAKYETGSHQPDYETLRRLADFFFVSIDYLIGRTDDPRPPRNTPNTDCRFQLSERLRRTREEKNLSVEILADKLGLDPASIKALEEGSSRTPTAGVLSRLADSLGVTPAYLVGDADDPVDPGPVDAWYQPRELFHFLRESAVMLDGVILSETDKQRIRDVLTGLFWETIQKNRKSGKYRHSGDSPSEFAPGGPNDL